MSDDKLNSNPLPGITHAFYCTHEAVLCACWAAEVERIRVALADTQTENELRYLCLNGHHVVSPKPWLVGTPCSAPLLPGGRMAVMNPADGVACGAPLQRYVSPDWFDEDINAEVVALRWALQALYDASDWDVFTATRGALVAARAQAGRLLSGGNDG